jgi:hypothetical protein
MTDTPSSEAMTDKERSRCNSLVSLVRVGRDESKTMCCCSTHTRQLLRPRHDVLRSLSNWRHPHHLEKRPLLYRLLTRLIRTKPCTEDGTRLAATGARSSRNAQRLRATPTTSSLACSSTRTRLCLLRTTTRSTFLIRRRAPPRQDCKVTMEACGRFNISVTCSYRDRRIARYACGTSIEVDVRTLLSDTPRPFAVSRSSNQRTSTRIRTVILSGNHRTRSLSLVHAIGRCEYGSCLLLAEMLSIILWCLRARPRTIRTQVTILTT